jgi:putative hydrolases of HD superfamily
MAHHAVLPDVSEVDMEFASLLDFVLEMDRLKEVERRNPIADGSRRERTAEHCWYVALAVIAFRKYAAERVDVGRAAILAIVHDVPEVRVGDTFAYGPLEPGRRQRESRAMEELLSGIPADEATGFHTAWTEYEYSKTPEGRYVYALDSLLPVFLNLAGGSQSSWVCNRVSARVVRERIDKVRRTIPELAGHADRAVDEGVRLGYLE